MAAFIPPPVLERSVVRALQAPLPWSGSRSCAGWTSTTERNVIILAISLAVAITPTVYPTIFAEFPTRRTNDHQQRHHHGQHHRDPAEPDLQRVGWQRATW